jgi:hypothetical protein
LEEKAIPAMQAGEVILVAPESNHGVPASPRSRRDPQIVGLGDHFAAQQPAPPQTGHVRLPALEKPP